MKLIDILSNYSDAAIDQLAIDKVDESANLRLPKNIIIQEISSALNTLTYVAGALAPARPPTYAFLRLLLDASDFMLPIEGFQEQVLNLTKDMSLKAETGKELTPGKNYDLYIKILKGAWEHENQIDRSEALLLESLRNELNIWPREHLLLEHHPNVRKFWDEPNSYISARNHLLITGLVLTHENNYIIAEEVAKQIRIAWSVEMAEKDYFRLLNRMKKEQIHNVLNLKGLALGGSKDELIMRLINSFIPPSEYLNFLHIDNLRNFCRNTGIQSSGIKTQVINNIIDFFNNQKDLSNEKETIDISPFPKEPEKRNISDNALSKLLSNLTNDQLYDILVQCYLQTSGPKDEKINRLLLSPWSEETILSKLRRIQLYHLCQKLNIRISGVKSELVEKLIEGAANIYNETTSKAVEQNQQISIEAKTIEPLENKIQTSSIISKNEAEKKPVGFKDIASEYPELDVEEQIILTLLKETKSLTEYDIERACHRHALGWFLTRAHMSEMSYKLRKLKKNPIKVKSVRSVNIYEWNNYKEIEEMFIERRAARDVIDALRQGVVPEKNLDLLIIGQSKHKQHLLELLDITRLNKSPFKFIKGPYGAGKSFLCSWLRERALEKEYSTSTVVIGPDQPLSDLPILYSGLINGLRSFEKRDSSALVDILESWLLNIHIKTSQIEGFSPLDIHTKDKLSTIVEQRLESELSYLSDLDPCFSPALRSFYKARCKSDPILASTAIAWLSGNRSISGSSLQSIGVKGYLESNQVFPRIRALIEVIKGAHFEGLLLIIDELELIRRFPQARQREQAYEILRLLIDESGKNGFPGCFIVYTGTDTFFEDERAGLRSYEALADRIINPCSSDVIISMRQPVIEIEGLDHDKLITVAKKIRDIHGIAYNWESKMRITDEILSRIVKDWTDFSGESVNRKPRPVLRELINILDLCEENPELSYNNIFQISSPTKEQSLSITDIVNK